jgi:glyoxylase-like metal-dependent hydrolase (beta-lactamase superfamily II)
VDEKGFESALRVKNLPTDTITTPFTHFLIDTGENCVLVSKGAGDLSSKTGNLIKNLKAVGIDPPNVDIVIVTHSHPDHIY